MDTENIQEEKKEVKLSKIEETRQLVERLEKANAEHKALVDREENIRTDKMLSGETLAGQPLKGPEEVEREKVQKLADEITNAFK